MIEFNDTKQYRDKLKRERKLPLGDDVIHLKPMPKMPILCGTAAGLPFDCLMTDVMSGCLNINNICYGNCTAADYWITQGYDFGKRVLNEFNEVNFRKYIDKLPKSQKWLRQGWISDCSFTAESWNLTAQISTILNEYGISLLIITKSYTKPSKDVLQTLARNNTELRVSVSAFDLPKEINQRLAVLEDFREAGGKSIPYVMTSRYVAKDLSENQERLVKYVTTNDYIAGEHPLRFNNDNKILPELMKDGFWHPKFPDQYWFGRVLFDVPNFVLPAPTHLSGEYTLKFKKFSELPSGEKIPGIQGNLPTFEQLTRNNQSISEGLFKHATYIIQKS